MPVIQVQLALWFSALHLLFYSVADIIKALRDYGGGEITIGANTDSRASHQYNIELAERRAKSVRDVIRRALGDELMSDVKIEVDPAVYQEAER